MMKKEDFYFKLPEELIAQDPLEDRSASRLLVLDKESGKIEHRMFRDIKAYLKPGDCLVINDTKVIPARLIGSKIGTDAKIEIERKMISGRLLSSQGKRQNRVQKSVLEKAFLSVR